MRGMTVTADELKQHLPMLCRRLNGDELLVSLSGLLGDTDREIVEKKLKSTEPTALTIMHMYTAVKRRMGSDHVKVFLQAVQDQFPDLSSLGIVPANNAEGTRQFPIHRRPDPPWEASATPQYRPRDSERSVPGPAMQTQPVLSRAFAHPPTPTCDQRGFGPPGSHPPNTNSDFPPSPYSKWGSFAPSHLKSSGGYSNLQPDDWSREIQRPRNSKAPEAGSPYPLMSNGARPFTDPDGVSYSPEQSEISMAGIVANIAGKGMPAPPQCDHARPAQIHLSGPSITETARVNGNANSVYDYADMSLNILPSVEDNNHVDMSTRAARQTSSEAARPLVLSGPPSLSLDKSNIQTDTDLPTEDVQPEQPDDAENSNCDDGTRDDLQRPIVPPQDPMDRSPIILNVNIGKVVVDGEGNQISFSAQNSFEAVFKKQGRQISRVGYEDKPPTGFEASSLHNSMEGFKNSSSNVEVLEPTQSSKRRQPGQNTYIPIQCETPPNPRGLLQQAQSSDGRHTLSPSKSANHQTLPKAIDQTVSELALPQTHLQNLGRSPQFLEQRSEQTVAGFPDDAQQYRTLTTESFQNRQNSEDLRKPPYVSDMSSFSSSSIHHNTKLKGKWQNQAEEANTTETKWQNQAEEADTTETKWQNQAEEVDRTETKWQNQAEEADTMETKWQNQAEEADRTETKWQDQAEEVDRTETKWQNQAEEANTMETKWQNQAEEVDTTETKWQNQAEEADRTETKWQNQAEEVDTTETKWQNQAEEADTTETKWQNQAEEADTTPETKWQNQAEEVDRTETKWQNQAEEADTTETKWQNQAEEADTTETKWQNQAEEVDTMETNLRKSDPVQVADMRTGSQETRLQEQRWSLSFGDPCPSEAGSLQTTDYLTYGLLKPGCLLGPKELLHYEAQRDESVELPSHLALSGGAAMR